MSKWEMTSDAPLWKAAVKLINQQSVSRDDLGDLNKIVMGEVHNDPTS